MNRAPPHCRLLLTWLLTAACSAPEQTPNGSDTPSPGSGGAVSGSGGSSTTAGAGGGVSTGGVVGTGGAGGTAGSATAGSAGSAGGPSTVSCEPGPIAYELDCGALGLVLEAHGPPDNRINYVIV